jgi:hypothetical protein
MRAGRVARSGRARRRDLARRPRVELISRLRLRSRLALGLRSRRALEEAGLARWAGALRPGRRWPGGEWPKALRPRGWRPLARRPGVARARLARLTARVGGRRERGTCRPAGKGTRRVRVGELGRRRDRCHRAAGRDRWRIAQVQRSRGLAWRLVPLVVRLSVPVTRVGGTSVRDRARRFARSRAEAARVAEGSELACAGPARRHVELVAGHLSIGRVRKPGTPILGTLGVPWPAIAAPRPVTHPFYLYTH